MHHDKKDEDLVNVQPLPVKPEVAQTEKDADEQAHQKKDDVPAATEEKDLDEVVHQQPALPMADATKLADPDDRVHDTDQDAFGSE